MLEQCSINVPDHIVAGARGNSDEIINFLKSECKKLGKKFKYIDGVESRGTDSYEIIVVVSKQKRLLIRRNS